jgi:hypothetical protein
MRFSVTAIPAAALLALLPVASSAAVADGTVLVGNLDQAISSQTAHAGEAFTLSDVHSQDRNLHDAVIYGHVASVQRQSQGQAAKIEFIYDKLHTKAGSSYVLQARTEEAVINTKSNALKEAGGALGGMAIGNMIGKALGTNAGGAVGAAGGYLYAKNNRAPITMPQGSQVTVRVDHARYLGVNSRR